MNTYFGSGGRKVIFFVLSESCLSCFWIQIFKFMIWKWDTSSPLGNKTILRMEHLHSRFSVSWNTIILFPTIFFHAYLMQSFKNWNPRWLFEGRPKWGKKVRPEGLNCPIPKSHCNISISSNIFTFLVSNKYGKHFQSLENLFFRYSHDTINLQCLL